MGGAMSGVVRGAYTSHNPTSKTPCYLRGAGQSRAQYVLGSAQQVPPPFTPPGFDSETRFRTSRSTFHPFVL